MTDYFLVLPPSAQFYVLMAGTEDDFNELLGGEVYIDMERLVDTSRHGIPEKVRGEVWKHLLEVSKPDKCTYGKITAKKNNAYYAIIFA